MTESERRQYLFATAVEGTVECARQAPIRFLTRILMKTHKTRASRRYAGHLRVRCEDYRMALVAMLEEDASDPSSRFKCRNVCEVYAIGCRTRTPVQLETHTHGILNSVGSPSAFDLSGEEFALAAEGYYRRELRAQYLREACESVRENCAPLIRVS